VQVGVGGIKHAVPLQDVLGVGSDEVEVIVGELPNPVGDA
jgi:hypothetical protein